MPSEAENAVAAWFFLSKELSKRKPIPGADRIAAAIMERAREDWRDRVVDEAAARDDYERSLHSP
jgi:hypothetical protein